MSIIWRKDWTVIIFDGFLSILFWVFFSVLTVESIKFFGSKPGWWGIGSYVLLGFLWLPAPWLINNLKNRIPKI